MFAPNSGSYSFHSPITPPSERESSTTITISEPSYASSNGGSSQSGYGTTSTSTLGTITITPTSGTSITITPTSATTITITPSSGATTVTIAPTSGTTSTSRPGHTPSPSPFSVPSQASQPLQTSISNFNRINRFDLTQPGNRGGFGHSSFNLCQNNSGLLFGTGCPATNPFGALPERPTFGRDTSSPSVQDGISGSFTATMDLRESIKNQTDVALGITRQLLLTEGKNMNMVLMKFSKMEREL